MGTRTTIQILLIIISVVIITTYIRPTFVTMQETQDETKQYREALDNAAKFNAELQRLVDTVNSFSTTERRVLDRYLPREIDGIAVMRDIETIVTNNRMRLMGLQAAEGTENRRFAAAQGQTQQDGVRLDSASFTLQAAGTYEQFKSFLQDIERNAYPLEATAINFTAVADESAGGNQGLYQFILTLETYALDSSNEEE